MGKLHGKHGRVVVGAADGTDEQQTVTVTSTASTFTLTFNAATTDAINGATASADNVKAALEALSTIGYGNTIVTGSAGGPYTVQFTGALGQQNVSAMTASNASIVTTIPGVAGSGNGLAVRSWSVEHEVAGDESTSTEDNGFGNVEFGIEQAPWTVEAQWDSNQSPYSATPPNLYPGLTVQLTLQTGRASSAKKFFFPTAKVLKASIKSVVDSIITWTVTGHSGGRFTPPT